MGYRADQQKLSKGNPRAKLRSEADLDFGIYVGEVIVRPKDETHSGRIPVYIPMLGKDRNDPSGYYNCFWTSPFAGSTPSAKLGLNRASYVDAQKSYGLWMVPPDPGNFVLVAFADGKKKFPVIVSCLFPDQLQFMVPGNAASSTFGTDIPVPTAEKNKREDNPSHAFNSQRPLNPYALKPLLDQGLLMDPVRGTTTASARRESPSEVFGILTPGADQLTDLGKIDGTNRLAGHSFVMDDSLIQRHIRFRTGAGAQILMDDTNEIVYIINQRGSTWLEMTADGDIHAYCAGKFNVRALQDINLHSDSNVNIQAENSVNIRAGDIAKQTQNNDGTTAGEGAGLLKLEGGSRAELVTGDGGTTFSTNGSHSTIAVGDMFTQAGGTLHSTSGEGTFITSGSDMHFSSGGTVNSQAASRNNVLGSTVHLNDGGSAVQAQQPVQIEAFKPLGYTQPGPLPAPFDYNINDVNPETDPLPSGGNGPGNRPEAYQQKFSIVTEFPTREPWYRHTLELPATADTTSMTESQDAPANTKPASITDELQPRPQPAPGRPGETVPSRSPAAFVAPDGTELELTRKPAEIPVGSTIKWRPTPDPDGTSFTSKLSSAAAMGDPLGAANSIGDNTDKLGSVISGLIQTTPDVATIGYPYGTDYKGDPIIKDVAKIVGKNHVLSPNELKAGAVVQGMPGAKNKHGFPIGIDPTTKLDFHGLPTLDNIIQQANLPVNGGQGLEQFGAVKIPNTNSYRLTDTKDPTKSVVIQALVEPMAEETATMFLKSDLQNTRITLGKTLQNAPGMSTQNFLGLTSFATSIGYTNWMKSAARDSILTGKPQNVAFNMMKWIRLYGRIIKPELLARRKAEAAMFNARDVELRQITQLLDSNGQSVGSWLELYNRISYKPDANNW